MSTALETTPDVSLVDIATSDEKRQHARLPYSTHHEIAPCRAGVLPPADLFFPVACYDISQAGFSFVTDRLPAMSSLVLRMRIHDRPVNITAQVMNHRQSPSNAQLFIVGCRFTSRLEE